jgi:hypothetical protein
VDQRHGDVPCSHARRLLRKVPRSAEGGSRGFDPVADDLVSVPRPLAEVGELEATRPANALTPGEALQFALLRLTVANHAGSLEVEPASEVRDLAEQMRSRDPAPWAQARLACLVAMTNRLDFEGARRDSDAQSAWCEPRPEHPWQLVCLHRSSLLAMRGDAAAAKRHLQQAIDLCDRPSAGGAVTTLTYMKLVMQRCGRESGLLQAPIVNVASEALAVVSPPMRDRRDALTQPLQPESLYRWRRTMLPFNYG